MLDIGKVRRPSARQAVDATLEGELAEVRTFGNRFVETLLPAEEGGGTGTGQVVY